MSTLKKYLRRWLGIETLTQDFHQHRERVDPLHDAPGVEFVPNYAAHWQNAEGDRGYLWLPSGRAKDDTRTPRVLYYEALLREVRALEKYEPRGSVWLPWTP